MLGLQLQRALLLLLVRGAGKVALKHHLEGGDFFSGTVIIIISTKKLSPPSSSSPWSSPRHSSREPSPCQNLSLTTRRNNCPGYQTSSKVAQWWWQQLPLISNISKSDLVYNPFHIFRIQLQKKNEVQKVLGVPRGGGDAWQQMSHKISFSFDNLPKKSKTSWYLLQSLSSKSYQISGQN